MAMTAQSQELKEGFQAHLAEMELQAQRLEEVAQGLEETIHRKKCKAMKGLMQSQRNN